MLLEKKKTEEQFRKACGICDFMICDIPVQVFCLQMMIQEWLGHSNFTITANLYSHLEYNAKVNSAETIARALGAKAND